MLMYFIIIQNRICCKTVLRPITKQQAKTAFVIALHCLEEQWWGNIIYVASLDEYISKAHYII